MSDRTGAHLAGRVRALLRGLSAGLLTAGLVAGDFAGDPSGIPGRQIVRPLDVEVIAPTPDEPSAAPSGAYLTLTTCHPRFSARQRLVLHATLDGPGLPKANDPGGPDALHER